MPARVSTGWQDALAATADDLLRDEDPAALNAVIAALQARLALQLPQADPGFALHMSKPPHGVAWLAQALASALQPNNHNRDAGVACTEMELEAIAMLGRMVGWPHATGHLCSGGTVANLEALWVARERLGRGATVLVTDQAHYAHRRNAQLLGLRCEVLPADGAGRWALDALDARLAQGDPVIIVATVGTTALGAVDPLHALAARRRDGAHLLVDAAYGGYHTLAFAPNAAARAPFDALARADAIVIDPHKHGLQPLGCAAVLYPDATVREVFEHTAPYCYFDNGNDNEGDARPGLHLGQLGLEGSRIGATAAALWATLQLMPLVRGGRFAHMLAGGLEMARTWHQRLAADGRWHTLAGGPDLDVVVWRPLRGNVRALREAAAAQGLHLGLVRLPARLLGGAPQGEVEALRAVWMKPLRADERDACWAAWTRACQACA